MVNPSFFSSKVPPRKGVYPLFLGILSNFHEISFLIRALLLWEKVTEEEINGENGGKKQRRKEKTDENSGHYVIASSRPLERRTLTPKYWSSKFSPRYEGWNVFLSWRMKTKSTLILSNSSWIMESLKVTGGVIKTAVGRNILRC